MVPRIFVVAHLLGQDFILRTTGKEGETYDQGEGAKDHGEIPSVIYGSQ